MKKNRTTFVVCLLSILGIAGCQSNTKIERLDYIVVTANPHATQAGVDVIESGGSAVDAAIAIHAVLTLVEPQSSGLAGGGFLMHYDASTKEMVVYDGRERAPASATKDMFLADQGKPIPYLDAKHSGISTGVPSAVAMFEMAHKDFGQRPWSSLFYHAQTLASEGFAVSPRLHSMISRYGGYLPSTPEEGPTEAYNYFHVDGEPLPVGYILKNQAYADALNIIAANPKAFYNSKITNEIIEEVSKMPRASGMTLDDINAYKPQKRNVLCSSYRDMEVCGPPPPSSWIAVSNIMSLLNEKPSNEPGGASNWKNWRQFINAQRLAYADRDRFIADPEFVKVPINGLMNGEYLESRAAILDSLKPVEPIAGNPWPYNDEVAQHTVGKDMTQDIAGTTHFVVVDRKGDVVSMTASVESIFGSGRMAGGMFLNNQLTDFSFRYEDDKNRPIANAVAPGKKPRSSMSPTIILDKNGEFLMATGSPGGSNIVAYTAKSIIGVLDWGLSPQEAIALPNVVARGDTVRVEANTGSEALIKSLTNAGYKVDGSRGENSGLSVVLRKSNGKLIGGVDARREGTIGQNSQ